MPPSDNKGDEAEEKRNEEEAQPNKERYEYEEAIEAMEGNGKLPAGWFEGPPEEVFQHFRPKVVAPLQLKNLRLRPGIPGFWVETRTPKEEETVGEEGDGSGLDGDPKQEVPTHELGKGDDDKSPLEMTAQQWKKVMDHRVLNASTKILRTIGMNTEIAHKKDNIDPITAQKVEQYKEMRKAQASRREKEDMGHDMWAQEQVDKAVNYGKRRADIQDQEKEIQVNEVKGSEGLSNPIGPSQSDGPSSAYHFLNNTDPIIDPMEYYSVRLNPEEIARCRQTCETLGSRPQREKKEGKEVGRFKKKKEKAQQSTLNWK